MARCIDAHVPRDVDLLLVDYAVNDATGQDAFSPLRRSFERVVRQARVRMFDYWDNSAAVRLPVYEEHLARSFERVVRQARAKKQVNKKLNSMRMRGKRASGEKL